MRVNEIFYSLQGEGLFTGVPAVFVRLSGCNLACDFCDTDHAPFVEIDETKIVDTVASFPATHVVITGGEPALQLTLSLVERLHRAGKFVQIETNGTIAIPDSLCNSIDWITCSPKRGHKPVIGRIDELKVVYEHDHIDHIEEVAKIKATHYSLQPCDRHDTGYNSLNLKSCVNYIMAHPHWRLSLQTHKLLNIK